jgi:hypothetical protein
MCSVAARFQRDLLNAYAMRSPGPAVASAFRHAAHARGFALHDRQYTTAVARTDASPSWPLVIADISQSAAIVADSGTRRNAK